MSGPFARDVSGTSEQNGSQLPVAFLEAWDKLQTILNDGPITESDRWSYELMKWARGDIDAKYMSFDVETLRLGFHIHTSSSSISRQFYLDIQELIPMLPVKDGQQIERKLLVDLLLEAAKECNMKWHADPRVRPTIFFGVMEACAIHRWKASKEVDDELGGLMAKTSLGQDNAAVMTNLGQENADVVSLLDAYLRGEWKAKF